MGETKTKTQELVAVIIKGYSEHRAWCDDDIELRVRMVGSQWETWIAGLGSNEGDHFPTPASKQSTVAESLEMSLALLAVLIADESSEQFTALQRLRELTQ